MKEDNYCDIINLKHHVSINHPRMSMESRAAQFAPFAALTGYNDAVRETERLTDKKIEMEEEFKLILSDKLRIILENIKNNPEVTFTYFIPDTKKSGGKYVSVTGIVKKIDMVLGYVMLVDKVKIPIDDILNISSDLFKFNEMD